MWVGFANKNISHGIINILSWNLPLWSKENHTKSSGRMDGNLAAI
jgi:hypothetical protein